MAKVINIDTKTRTIRIDNADSDKDITWRTTETGTHFPIKKGESTKEALDKFVEKKQEESPAMRAAREASERMSGLKLAIGDKKNGVKKESGLLGDRYDRTHGTKPEKSNAPLLSERKGPEDVDHSGLARGEPTYDELMEWSKKQKAKKKTQPAKASSEQTKEIDAKIKDKKQELQNIIKSLSENVEDGYFDIAQEMMTDVEYVKGELKQLMDERAKMQQQPAKKEPERDTARKHVEKAQRVEAETGIAPEDYEAYESVRQSGAYNMFDLANVSRETGLDRETIRKIQKNYSVLRDAYGSEEDE